MPIPLSEALALAMQCAPAIAPETMMAIVQVESRFNPLAIGVNGRPRVTVTARTPGEAAARASALIAAGRSVDLGLAQINSSNLEWLGLSVEAAFDPCLNLAAAQRVFQDGYARAGPGRTSEQAALLTALSYYNTGHPRRGFANGYVVRVTRAASRFTPAIPTASGVAASSGPFPAPVPALDVAPVPVWDVFRQAEPAPGFFIRASTSIPGDVP
ncbi:lytic transglycosylase domain-containing protein [Brevundimonas diminuta]|uniref:lytic transglycosylase domain-containing protein n=1 Tax=Brevundimonas TaxID=41275 RepID=UPI001906EADA|nr:MULTISPECIES: lytic transglycosylase domain-containing protein [Brevundimonas]MBK1976172.1 lytic transglycosylase domain-containing protein [Brevundimonas diminuta]